MASLVLDPMGKRQPVSGRLSHSLEVSSYHEYKRSLHHPY